MQRIPGWADAILVPLISLIIAFAISGLVILAIGENPRSEEHTSELQSHSNNIKISDAGFCL